MQLGPSQQSEGEGAVPFPFPREQIVNEVSPRSREVPPLCFSGVQVPASNAAEPEEAPPPVSPFSQVAHSSRSSEMSTPESSSPGRMYMAPSAGPLTPPRRRLLPARLLPSLNLVNANAAAEAESAAVSSTPRSQRAALDSESRPPEYDRNAQMARVKRVCSPVLPDALYISGEAVAQDLALLGQHRITHVLNTAGDTCPNYFPERFVYLTFVLQDSRLTNEALEAVLFRSLAFIDKAITNGGRVLVHCREGVSRSATHVVAYLMWKHKMSFQSALEMVRSCRDVCNPNTGFTFTLLKFAKRLTQTSSPIERKLCRVTLHHTAAPFIVVLGVSLFEHSQSAWMPSGQSLTLDPRFFYLLRDGYQFYVWQGHKVPKHLLRVLLTTVQRFLDDVKYFESINDSDFKVVRLKSGEEPEAFWHLIRPHEGSTVGGAEEERVAELHLLDEEVEAMMGGLPEASIFSPDVWEQQLRASTREGRRATFAFQPPKISPRLQQSRIALESSASRRRLSDAVSSQEDVSYRECLPQLDAAVRASIANSLKTLASATAMQAGGRDEAAAVEFVGVGREQMLEKHLTYLFVYPDFLRAEVAVDEDCLQSEDILLFVRFGESADARNEEASESSDDEGFRSALPTGEAPRACPRSLTVPPFEAPLVKIGWPNSNDPTERGKERFLHSPKIDESTTKCARDLWPTRIWLWKGAAAPPLGEKGEAEVLASFCEMHNVSMDDAVVSIEEEENESDEFLKLVYLG